MSAPGPSAPSPAAFWRWAPACLVAAVLLAYANSVGAPFVYDDLLAIPENPSIRRLWPLTDVLLPQVQGGLTVSGRPVLNVSFALNHALSGSEVWSYHVTNALIHAGGALLLFGIVRRTLSGMAAMRGTAAAGDRPAFLALTVASGWALHPVQTQAVTYTVQRAESLMGFFYLLTLYAFLRGAGREQVDGRMAGRDGGHPLARRRWLATSVAACTLGMGTKEVMATAPLMILLYDRTFVAGGFAAAWRSRRGYYVALAASWILLAALVASTGDRGGTAGFGVGVPLWAYPLTQFKALATYLSLAVWPHPLVFEYGTFWVQRAADIAPYAAIVLPLLTGTLIALSSHRPAWRAAGFLGAWFFGILAPTSLTPGTIQMIVEHRVYLPLAAVVAALALGVTTILGRRTWIAACLAAVALLTLTVRRNHDYRSRLALWADTVAKRPLNPRAHEGLAEALAELGRIDEAVKHRQESIRLLPDESTYHYNLGLTLADAGRFEEAVRHYRLALQLFPNEARTHNNLAIALGKLGRGDEALQHYADAVRLRPDDPQYHYNYGVALQRAGRLEAAVERYREALRLAPGHADAHFNLGAALAKQQQLDAALPHYERAVHLRPDDIEFRLGRGAALLHAGRVADAVAEFRAAAAREPDSLDAQFALGNALAAHRQLAEAVAVLGKVVQRAPDHAHARVKLGNALLDLDRVDEAAVHLERAAQLLPQDAEVQNSYGVACARAERWPEARRQFERALSLNPGYGEARRNLERLRALLGP